MCFSFLKKEMSNNIIIIYSNYNGEISLTSKELLFNINKDIFSIINEKNSNKLDCVKSNWNIFFEEIILNENQILYNDIIKNFE